MRIGPLKPKLIATCFGTTQAPNVLEVCVLPLSNARIKPLQTVSHTTRHDTQTEQSRMGERSLCRPVVPPESVERISAEARDALGEFVGQSDRGSTSPADRWRSPVPERRDRQVDRVGARTKPLGFRQMNSQSDLPAMLTKSIMTIWHGHAFEGNARSAKQRWSGPKRRSPKPMIGKAL
jgi:hypothetical protein